MNFTANDLLECILLLRGEDQIQEKHDQKRAQNIKIIEVPEILNFVEKVRAFNGSLMREKFLGLRKKFALNAPLDLELLDLPFLEA